MATYKQTFKLRSTEEVSNTTVTNCGALENTYESIWRQICSLLASVGAGVCSAGGQYSDAVHHEGLPLLCHL